MEYIDRNFKPVINKMEIQEMYRYFNDNNIDNDYDNLVDVFYHTLKNHADRIAIIDDENTVTYQMLHEYSDNVAHYLDSYDEKFLNYVIVKVARNWETIGIIIGILKAGKAYVPVQKDIGEERLKSIMEVTGEKETISYLTQFPVRSSEYTKKSIKSDSPAYIIFTSGSTGQPKGVRIPHKSVIDTILTMNYLFGLNEYDRILGVSELTFDLSIFDLFGTICAGASLVIVQDNRNLALLEEIIHKDKVTFVNAVPSVVKLLLEYLKEVAKDFSKIQTIRTIILSGDVVPKSLVEIILGAIPNVDLFISGGPTEITIWSNYYLYEKGKSILSYVPYGQSIPNKTMYIMKDGQLVSEEEGEIVSGGVGLALDYINDPTKTSKQFIQNDELGRIYFTGDRGILTHDGLIQILGRIDNQVKINGFRVELEEIENHLNQMEEISQSISCVVKTHTGDKLIAGLKLNIGQIINEVILKERLSEFIPEYSIPHKFLILDELPLSANNKVDRKEFLKIAQKEI